MAKEYKDGYGVGFKMLEKMGFSNISKGLGKNETGIHRPVEATHKTAFTLHDNHKPSKKKQKNSDDESDQL